MTPARKETVKAWIAAILWLIVIAIESTAYLSSENTSRFLYPMLHFLFGIDHASFEPWHFFLRKSGHVFGYGLLSILLAGAASLGMAFSADFLDPSFRTPAEVISYLGAPVLVSIPRATLQKPPRTQR